MSRATSIRQQSGQAFVEFALVIGILTTLVFSILALWPIINSHDAIAMAAASGAHQAAITGGDVAQVEQIVRSNLEVVGLGIDPEAVAVEVTCGGRCRRYDPVTVTVVTHVKPWIKLPWVKQSYQVAAQYTRASELDGSNGGSTGGAPIGGPVPGPIPEPGPTPQAISPAHIPGSNAPSVPGGRP